MKVVKSLTDLEGVTNTFVLAVCCKCGDLFTSLIENAKVVVTKGCVVCNPTWQPTVGIIHEREPKKHEMAVDLSGLEDKWSYLSHENCVECGMNFEDNNEVPLRLWKNPESEENCMELALCWGCAKPRMGT